MAQEHCLFDPVTLDLKGNLPVTEPAGGITLRTTIDFLHRQLLLGEVGRYYSELAASLALDLAIGWVISVVQGGKKNQLDSHRKQYICANADANYHQFSLCIFSLV